MRIEKIEMTFDGVRITILLRDEEFDCVPLLQGPIHIRAILEQKIAEVFNIHLPSKKKETKE
jgi:hypothetical protein